MASKSEGDRRISHVSTNMLNTKREKKKTQKQRVEWRLRDKRLVKG